MRAKKIIICFIFILCILSTFSVYASADPAEITNNETQSQLIQLKEDQKEELQDYVDQYDSETYGFTAYILAKIRLYSIPFCFVGIAVGAIYQYVIGIRRLDVRDRGFNLVIAFITIFVICQVLPLIFAVVVKGWGI